MNEADQLVDELRQNEQVLHVLELDQLLEEHKDRIKHGIDYVAPASDLATITKLLREFGISPDKVVVKTYGVKKYVIFKGYAGHRRILKGTRYLADNPKVVRMAIGRKGVTSAVRGGAAITVVLSVGLEVFDYLIRDRATLHELLGTVSADLVKIGLTTIASTVAGLAVGSATVLGGSAAAPLIAAVAVGVVVGETLNYIDKHVGATAALIEAYRQMGQDLENLKWEANRTWNWLQTDPCAVMQLFGGPMACRGY